MFWSFSAFAPGFMFDPSLVCCGTLIYPIHQRQVFCLAVIAKRLSGTNNLISWLMVDAGIGATAQFNVYDAA